MDDFLVRAFLTGIGVAVVAAPLGCFVVWRRMAYFGDTLSHSALLGVALGLLVGVDPVIGAAAACIAIALLLTLMRRGKGLAADTALGILAHGGLALGLVSLAFLETVRVDLFGYLFGDILAVGWGDVIGVFAGGLVVLGALVYLWRPLLSLTVHEDLARVEGVRVARVSLAFTVLMAIVVAVAMKVVGILLVTSLLIVPAATARRFASTPEAMALIASAIGVCAVGVGLLASMRFDTPAGPSIVVASVGFFALSSLIP
ncbi:MAG: metal ABC transporter permease, partial [Rhodospirillales bacterium]|nr:metal ABC transporter permease [Rhodospirillales bacterium]